MKYISYRPLYRQDFGVEPLSFIRGKITKATPLHHGLAYRKLPRKQVYEIIDIDSGLKVGSELSSEEVLNKVNDIEFITAVEKARNREFYKHIVSIMDTIPIMEGEQR